jgi:hypothetical protein
MFPFFVWLLLLVDKAGTLRPALRFRLGDRFLDAPRLAANDDRRVGNPVALRAGLQWKVAMIADVFCHAGRTLPEPAWLVKRFMSKINR